MGKSNDSIRRITEEELSFLEIVKPQEHYFITSDEGLVKCAHCNRAGDDPFIVVCGGWKKGQCWGEMGPDFIMMLMTMGWEPAQWKGN